MPGTGSQLVWELACGPPGVPGPRGSGCSAVESAIREGENPVPSVPDRRVPVPALSTSRVAWECCSSPVGPSIVGSIQTRDR